MDGASESVHTDDGVVARSERFELPALGIEIRYSIQLSYERIWRVDYPTCVVKAGAGRAAQ